ncbi:thioredoxin domain-containing protein [Chitinophaga filiformis]|uniref:thioredoxin domain-containing protein n=1 Tax=Chitinophaga filiformis TaxID=104663 RepID=UPI001F339E0F|nr:thioredoxin domain-containing protein [Chitinophaga filiformis]MCF6401633.1 thioredoxin domain-containing protein [Chitinophaga filiformis]
MNRLAKETSPYLLQHAHNPVDWYPWGDEALQRAKAEDKPILVSIGYAACHWCHVMERESFEDVETARIMNELFINIKIDREERPDLDHIYMDAVQAMTGSGGWPLNVFLTPDKLPFYGGTYFPPVKAFNRPSWKEVLLALSQAFRERREDLETQAENMREHLTQASRFGEKPIDLQLVPKEELFTREQCNTIFSNMMQQGDKIWGGFGSAPKFPGTFIIQYLLRYHHSFNEPQALQQALLSLDKMIQGGIYDQLGGGFARYSTDAKWLAPHFEKMLYDNALLVDVMSEAYQLTGNELYASTIADTLGFVEREMTDAGGGFYSALDADSEGVEGKFYTWSREEIEAVLGPDAALFCAFYDVTEHGNWEETNILWITKPASVFAAENGMTEEALERNLAVSREKLMAVRAKRIRPGLDDKIILGWNALMIHACCRAYAALGVEKYREMGVNAMKFCLNNLQQLDKQSFFHTFKAGVAKYPAFLDDYAWLVRALIALQEVTGDADWLEKAREITEYVITNFSDEGDIYFYYTEAGQTDVIVRKKEVYDGATPSGNAVMASNLLYLSIVYDKKQWSERGVAMLAGQSQMAVRYSTSFGVWAGLLLQLVQGVKEIAVVGKDYKSRMQDTNRHYIPFKVILGATTDTPGIPLLEQRERPGETLIYVCEHYHCIKPVNYIEEIINLK